MLLWALNYSNSLAFALTFLLGAVGLNAMWRTHNNLLHLTVDASGAEPVFAGQQARWQFHLSTADSVPRYAVALCWPDSEPHYCDVSTGSVALTFADDSTAAWLVATGAVESADGISSGLVSGLDLGHVSAGRPGLFPGQPVHLPLPQVSARSHRTGETGSSRQGDDDFNGLRIYSAGDSSRRIAWRASARSEHLLVKQFSGTARAELWLDWAALNSLTEEARLSQLCQWLLTAEQSGHRYGLNLPGTRLEPDLGGDHLPALSESTGAL